MEPAKIWITGAGRGIGKEAAFLFAERGASLFLSARSKEELLRVASRCREKGAKVLELPLDVRSAEAVFDAVRRIEKEGGPPSVLFPAAGVGSFASLVETEPDEWNGMIETNLGGAFLCLRAALPGMIRAGYGKIILISSIAARTPFPNAAAYCASKAGVIALGNCVREELRGTGVRVSVLIPGAVDSSFWDRIGTDLDRARMLPTRTVAEAVVRLAEEPPEGTTEEMTLLPPDGVL